MGLKYTEPHKVTYYECDVTNAVTLPMMISIAIGASESQNNWLTGDPMYVYNRGLGWVITQHEIWVHRYPRQDEEIYVTTEADTYNKYFCYRNFYMHDIEGNELMKMTSVFVLMDLQERHIVAVPDEVIGVYQAEKITKIKRFDPIPNLEDPNSQQYRVRFSDIDGNGHVNNAKYLDWFMDVLGYDFLCQFEPVYASIRFDREVHYGNVIDSEWQFQSQCDKNPVTVHRISSGDHTCAEAKIDWRSRAE